MAADAKVEVGAHSGSFRRNQGKGVVPMQRQISRRGFLAAALATVTASATAPKLPGAFGFLHRFGKSKHLDNGVKVTVLPRAQNDELVALEEKDDRVLNVIFGRDKEAARIKVNEMKDLISSTPGFEDMNLKIPRKYEEHIREQAQKNGLEGDVMMGLVGIENGGGEAVYGDDGRALGVLQFWEGTARDYDLVVNDEVDERRDPLKSITAGAEYLRVHKQLLSGNEGLAVWAFNVGMGNTFKALQAYFAETRHYNIGNYGSAIQKKDPLLRAKIEEDAARLIKESGVTVHKLLTNEAVINQIAPNLYANFEDYPYKVAAIAQLSQERPKVLAVAR